MVDKIALSVLQSGIEEPYKRLFLGDNLKDICQTNVPQIRLNYREITLNGMIEKIKSRLSDA